MYDDKAFISPGAVVREQFTDRARRALKLANEEAQRFCHEYVGTEHILLGLTREETGAAALILKDCGIDPSKVRAQIEKIIQPGPDPVGTGTLPRTPRAKKVIAYSIEEARRLNCEEVDTGHLLLGTLRAQDGVAAQVLIIMGLRLDDVRQAVVTSAKIGGSGAESCG
jgi:ATP-dependent Clp protease ATP-binding subunit ClpC